ncbi:hypothetical protein P7M46_01065 [Bisgaard Taxon 10/6]|uniref:Uncharacterized protein n=1 Tax=Exercitatus varius TaxID=67857 RepID=A0AAW6QDA6_9PAST|nr:hypothetical protein [Exercitatus varius]MDG2916606.1 hypothetical protein [Exercitatus varius]MDG2941529.1 hypothetical protein [Exercitatus varius]MDG2950352.1 hypothetical protein [Exercitatus varius]
MNQYSLITLIACFLSASVMASGNTQTSEETRPVAFLQVLDASAAQPKPMEGNRFSRKDKRQLCVVVRNVEIQENNQLIENIKAPAKITMEANNARLIADTDGKGYRAVFEIPRTEIKNDVVLQCWEFGKQDPVGEYHVDVQFNNVVFKNLKFEVLP